jgi:acetyl esterase/lipase
VPYDDGLAALGFLDDPKNHPVPLDVSRCFVSGADRTHEAANFASPAAAAGLDSAAFPPVLLAIGGYDPLQDWQRRYGEMLTSKGKHVQVVEYPNAFHAFCIIPVFDDTRDLMIRIAKFVCR